MNIRTILLASGLLCSLVGNSWADGINSANSSDLPLGAGGTSFMWLGGGNNTSIPQGKIHFGAIKTSPKAWINAGDGSASFDTVNATNLTDSGNATFGGTVGIGGVTANATTIATANNLAAAPACSTTTSALTKNADGSFSCVDVGLSQLTLNLSCPAGQYLSGISNNSAVCKTVPAGATGATGCVSHQICTQYYSNNPPPGGPCLAYGWTC